MGTFTYENQGSNTFLVYAMDPDEQIDTLTEGMTSNNAISGVLVPGFVQSNMERRLKYNISSKISLGQYFSGNVRKKQLFGILESMTAAMLAAEGYLLADESFLLDEDFIFVDVGQKAAFLLAFPVEQKAGTQNGYYDFVRRMMFGLNFDETEDCAYVAALMNYINRKENFSLRGFLETVKRLDRETGIRSAAAESSEKRIQAPPSDSRADAPSDMPKAGPQLPPVRETQKTPPVQTGQTATAEAAKQAAPEKEKKSPLHSLFGKKADAQKAEKKEGGKAGKNKGSIKRGMAFQIPGRTAQAEAAPQEEAPPEPVKPERPRTSHVPPQYNGAGQTDFGSTVIMGGEEDAVTVIAGSGIAEPEGERLVTITRVKNGQTMVIEQEIFRIGKSSGFVDFYIGDNGTVSRSHADILTQNGGVYIRDNNSLNHTYVNGQMVRAGEQLPLSDGDRIRLSDEEFVIAMKNG